MDPDRAATIPTPDQVIADLRANLRAAEETLSAIRNGEVDAVLVNQSGSNKIFTLVNADRPYRSLIEQMKEGAVTFSDEGVVLYGNGRLAEIVGAPLEQIVGSNIRRFFRGEDLVKFESLLARAGQEPSRAELALLRTDKTVVPIYVSISDIVSEPGAARLIGGVVTDLTEQHEIDACFSQARKMEAVGQLTGGLAHEFNNLFQAVCGNLGLIQMRPDDAVGVRRWAERGLKAADRGSRLTSQLLAFSGTQQIDVQPVDVERLVRGMSDLLQATLGRQIRPVYELVSSQVPVLADPVQLELAILNLAINARDAMPGGGKLCITTRLREIGTDPELAPGEYLELSVADTGCGMSDSVRQRAFDPFFTTKGVGEGSGLGLAQVYGIARQAGGAARIASRPGAGTTVTLLLRQAGRPAPQVRVAARDESRPPGDAKPRILVIDDDPEIRSLLVETLEWSGYEVRDTGDGAAGLAMLLADPPDLLLVDYLMPGLSGAEVVKQARASGLTMPVIFATGYSNTLALNDAIGFKAAVLPKPFTLGELQQAAEAALAAGGRPTVGRRLA